jgi:chaperonin cofactor prefoldin|tara:strand:+ start:562 stop:753 length:192 start_codon:yes stop_codon:yes gene_type:complete
MRFMATTKEAITKIETHEKECSIRYANIEKRLEDGAKRFDKLENMIWAVYPFILVSLVLSRFV